MEPAHRPIELSITMPARAFAASKPNGTRNPGEACAGFPGVKSTEIRRDPTRSAPMDSVGKPVAGNRHVRIDERGTGNGVIGQASSHRALPRVYNSASPTPGTWLHAERL